MPAELPAQVLAPNSIHLGGHATDKLDVLRQSASVLVAAGAVEAGYGEAMLDRENSVSTYLGEGVAIPHGTNESRALVHRTALGFLQFPEGVDWGLPDGDKVVVAIPIAAVGNEHLTLLAALAEILTDPDRAAALRGAARVDDVLAILGGGSDGSDGSGGVAGSEGGEREGVVT